MPCTTPGSSTRQQGTASTELTNTSRGPTISRLSARSLPCLLLPAEPPPVSLACLSTLSPASPGASCVILQGLSTYLSTSQYLTRTNPGCIFILYAGVRKRTAMIRRVLWGAWPGILVQNRLQCSERRQGEPLGGCYRNADDRW